LSTTAAQPGTPSEALCHILRALASPAAHHRSVPLAGVSCQLDDRSRALAGLGALLATGGASSAYESLVTDALAAGMSVEEIVDVLIEVAPIVGLARLVPAAVELGRALGYDVERALEGLDDVDDEDR